MTTIPKTETTSDNNDSDTIKTTMAMTTTIILIQAVNDLVRETLEGAQKALRKEKAAGNAAMIDDAVAKMSDKERAKVSSSG